MHCPVHATSQSGLQSVLAIDSKQFVCHSIVLSKLTTGSLLIRENTCTFSFSLIMFAYKRLLPSFVPEDTVRLRAIHEYTHQCNTHQCKYKYLAFCSEEKPFLGEISTISQHLLHIPAQVTTRTIIFNIQLRQSMLRFKVARKTILEIQYERFSVHTHVSVLTEILNKSRFQY